MQLPTLSSSRACGLAHVQPSGEHAYLPLEKAAVHANVVDVSAIITVTQQFWQYSPEGLERAKYIFPVPARAAVCAFRLIVMDGTVIAAVAKEKEQARREHEDAIAQGLTTGLVEHVTDDVFSISLGALPGRQMITTEITYVLDLMEEDIVDQVRLQIPMYVGLRYGTPPEGNYSTLQAPPERVSISADVRMHGAVRSITSPTHPALVLSGGDAMETHRKAEHNSPSFLTQDFVLCIAADGLDAPRCFAQRATNGATAMQLNIVPRFNLPAIPRQEYIFLVDRSGSMQGDKIEMAKRALVMLLRALPSEGTQLNIFSFGGRCDSLWPRSVPYDERSLKTATEHVDTMGANYGGTKILEALKQVLDARTTTTPTACFVLTDGQAYDIDSVLGVVGQSVQKAEADAPLRVFTLGIGDMTSTAMCEGIARAGNGVCLMSTMSEGIVGKCSRLLRASRTYVLRNVSVDWGVRTGLEQDSCAGDSELHGVRQAPIQLPTIYPGHRFVVFALIEDEEFILPKEVTIRAQRDGQGDVLQFSVPVQSVDITSEHTHPPLIPTLAARRAIMELEDAGRGTSVEENKAAIVKLGTTYQLASKYTSFIAVDMRTEKPLLDSRELAAEEMMVEIHASAPRLEHIDCAWMPPRRSRFRMLARYIGKSVGSTFKSAFHAVPLRKPTTPPEAATQNDESPTSPDNAVPDSPPSIEDRVLALVRLQSFDGSFSPSAELHGILGEELFAEAQQKDADQMVWATLLAVAFLKKHMRGQPELLEGLVEKALESVSRRSGGDVQTLLACAEGLVG